MNGKVNRNLLFFTFVLTAGMLLRFVYLAEYSMSPLFDLPLGPDVEEYNTEAMKFLAGGFPWRQPGDHAPLYSLFLAGLYNIFAMDFYKVRLFSLTMGLLAAIPLYFYLLRQHSGNEIPLTSSKLIPHIFFLFSALYPPLMFYGGEIISESLLYPLLCFTVYLLYRFESLARTEKKAEKYFYPAVAGLTAGLCIITHPACVIFIFMEVLYFIFASLKNRGQEVGKKAPALLFAVFILIPVLPVSLYNSYLAGRPVFVQRNSGFNFYLGNHAGASGLCSMRPGPEWDKIHLQAEKKAATKRITKDAYFYGKAFDFILTRPFRGMLNFIRKAVLFWNWREFTAGADTPPLRYFTDFQKYTFFSFAIAGFLGLAGLIIIFFDSKLLYAYRHFIMLLCGIWLTQIIFVTSGRYRMPALPSIFLFAAFFSTFLFSVFSDIKKIFPCLAALAVSGAVVFFPAGPLIDVAREKAEADSILAEGWMKKGNFEKAEKYIYFSMPELWNWTRTHNIFGIIAMERERFREARMAFETALETGGKGEVKTLVNLGVLSVNEGKTEDARSWFNTALSREPHSPEALYNSGLLEIKEKNYRRAEKYLAKCIAIQPSHKQALNNMGILKIYTNKPGEAEKYFRKALKLRPGDPQLMVNIAVTALMRDKFFKARVWLNKALASCPGYPPATVLKEKLDKVEEKSIK